MRKCVLLGERERGRVATRKGGGDDGAAREEAAARRMNGARRGGAGEWRARAPSFGEKAASAMDAAACVFRVSLRTTALFAEMQFS